MSIEVEKIQTIPVKPVDSADRLGSELMKPYIENKSYMSNFAFGNQISVAESHMILERSSEASVAQSSIRDSMTVQNF